MDIISCCACIFLVSGAVFFNCFALALLKLAIGTQGKGETLAEDKSEIYEDEIDEKMRHIENLMNYDPYKTGRQGF